MKACDPNFAQEIMEKSKTNVKSCYSCMTCSSGCQFQHIMDVKPHAVIRMVQTGFRDEALSASGPWLCVGCNTCSTNCPNAIDIPAVMDALRQTSITEKRPIPEPNILNFHSAVLHSIRRYGRTHKLEIMMRYKLVQRDLFSDVDLGLRMLAKRKLDLTASKIKELPEVKKLFNKAG
ncbi:4Fe-4S dicluster domain-containing protein [Desulfatiferula olefinivorans]